MLQTVRRVADLIGSDRPWRWGLLVGLALLVTALEAGGALLIYGMLRLISAPDGGVVVPLLGDLTEQVPDMDASALRIAAVLAVAVFFMVRGAVVVLRAYVQYRIVTNAGAALAGRLLRGYLSMPYLFHTRRNSAELIRNTYSATNELTKRVLTPLTEVGAELILVVGMICFLGVVSPAATALAALVLVPTVWTLQRIVQPRLKALGRRGQDASTASIGAVQQALGGIRDIKLLGREDAFAHEHLRQRMRLSRSQYLAAAFKSLPKALLEVALVLTIAVIFVAARLAGSSIQEILATLALFGYVGLRVLPSLQIIVDGLNEIKHGSAIIHDLDTDRAEIQDWLATTALAESRPTDTAALRQSLELRDVGFSYAPGGHPALRDVNLTIRRGEFIGICGPTGGGKSTLVDVIVGLLPPTTGEVLVDGEPMGVEPRWWFAQVGVVSQSVFLTDDTLRRNIALGVADGDIEEKRLRRAVRRAQLDDVVAGLPDGLDAVVGENGIRLSGGQRQRVAIARALYGEPPVLVLDEGTSALDGATEAALVEAIDEVSRGRTLIAVAHRISTVRDADRIVVIAEGRKVDEGTYDELQANSEVFRSLAR